jgi:hypothetical protein
MSADNCSFMAALDTAAMITGVSLSIYGGYRSR